MAKHLIEGRAFPLFFYGQNYMLAVEAWAAAPFFLISGATVTSLRLSILAWNIGFVWLVIEALRELKNEVDQTKKRLDKISAGAARRQRAKKESTEKSS